MKGECRFLKQKAGLTHFARVEVEITFGEEGEVVNGLPEKADAGAGEVARGSVPEWEEAALDGLRLAMAGAGHDGSPGAGCRAVLTRLIGTASDTRPDAVRCAAGLAAWRALGLEGPESVFDGWAWSVVFPAARPSPAEGVSR